MEYFKQSNFSRSLVNDAKLGAYYTDLNHCERIGQVLEFPEEEVCVLEPSIGDATAVLSVTKGCPKRKIYGVELNKETYDKVKEDQKLYVLNADFLSGVKISNKVFSFVFCNPPYGVQQDSNNRLETLFSEKLFNYMTPMGILVYVIPYPVLSDMKFFKTFFARYHIFKVYRFDDPEYKKYHQCVVFAQRRESLGYMRTWLDRIWSQIDSIEKLEYLPQKGEYREEPIKVPPSFDSKLEFFTTREFHADTAIEHLASKNVYEVIGRKGFLEPYTATELGHPAVPLKKDLLYLCAITGGGQGLTGSTINKDLHLQRGVTKIITTSRVESRDEGKKVLIENSSTKISLNIIQNDGTITVLE